VKQPLLSTIVRRRSMGDMCVVDFPSLLLIPMLERSRRDKVLQFENSEATWRLPV
jgi:hypothetical protein